MENAINLLITSAEQCGTNESLVDLGHEFLHAAFVLMEVYKAAEKLGGIQFYMNEETGEVTMNLKIKLESIMQTLKIMD